jgi:hypothetical protein
MKKTDLWLNVLLGLLDFTCSKLISQHSAKSRRPYVDIENTGLYVHTQARMRELRLGNVFPLMRTVLQISACTGRKETSSI